MAESTCDCIEQVNAVLLQHNTRLVLADGRLLVATERIRNLRDGKHPYPVSPTFCPFCGAKLVEAAGAKPMTESDHESLWLDAWHSTGEPRIEVREHKVKLVPSGRCKTIDGNFVHLHVTDDPQDTLDDLVERVNRDSEHLSLPDSHLPKGIRVTAEALFCASVQDEDLWPIWASAAIHEAILNKLRPTSQSVADDVPQLPLGWRFNSHPLMVYPRSLLRTVATTTDPEEFWEAVVALAGLNSANLFINAVRLGHDSDDRMFPDFIGAS
jgi:hypothetical protein